jgi:hypothetical protein
MFYIRETNYPMYEPWGREDHIFEYIQFFAFLLSSIILGVISYRLLKQKSLFTFAITIILSLGLLFVAVEEISWGQRVLDIPTDGIFLEKNVQQETNIHNLEPIHWLIRYAYLIIGFIGAFGWIARQIEFKNNFVQFIQQFLPRWFTLTYFLLLLINLFNTEAYTAPQDFEYIELLLSMGTLIYCIYMLKYFELNKPVELQIRKK